MHVWLSLCEGERQTDRQTDRQVGGQDIHIYRQKKRQTDIQTGRQIDRQTLTG